jgi:hypothetical protein
MRPFNPERIFLAVVMASMTELENLMMRGGDLVYSTLSSQQLEALFEDFQIAYSSNVRYDTNLISISDN